MCTTPEVGNIVSFGHYYQSTADTKEPIQWRILEIDSINRKMLLLSEYVLDNQRYHTSNAAITWEGSSLRSWLNNTFMTAAFSASEQAKILTTHLDNPNNPFCGKAGGNATDDKVFFLGLDDVYGENSNYSAGHWYFNNDTDRQVTATWYAVNKKVFSYNFDIRNTCGTTDYTINKCFSIWWLRSQGCNKNNLAIVGYEGNVDMFISAYSGVRPALWVNY